MPILLFLSEMAETEEIPTPKTKKQVFWDVVKTILKIGFTSLLLYLVLRKMDFEKVKSTLSASNPLYLLLAVLTFFLSQLVASSRLLSFFKSINLRLSFVFNLRLYMLGLFYNLFLPGGIGGDGYKIWLLNKSYKLPAKRVFWAIFFDRLSGLWAIGLIIVALIGFLPQIQIHLAIPLSVFVVGTAAYCFVAKHFFKDYTHFFFEAHAKAILVQSMQVITVLFVLLALHFNGKFSPYLFTFLAASLSAIVPFSVGGLGLREYIFVHFAPFFNMDPNLAVVVSLLFYLTSAVVSLLGIYYVFNTKRLNEGLPKPEETENLPDKNSITQS
ncbi:MAG: lysylphosphatidylglycerol synthase transmembrane domain-containing protein [Janthinobacterium lividum]